MRTAPLSMLTSTAASSHHPGPLQQQTYASTAASSHLCGRREALRNAAVYLLAAAAVSAPPAAPAHALPEECTNGAMEQRQALGLDPFAPPCDGPDPWARSLPPVYPVFVAKRAVDAVLVAKAAGVLAGPSVVALHDQALDLEQDL